MKINNLSRLAVLLLMVITSCTLWQENPGTDPTSSQAVSVVADTQEPGTKTTLSGIETQWVEGTDKIGLFSPQAKATEDGTPAANPAKNLAFTAQSSAKSATFKGSMYWGSETDHTFYAYYPNNSGYAGDQTAVPISLPSAQTQSTAGSTAHIGALDYMVATPLTVAYNGAVNLSFKHVFTMIEFQITGSGSLSEVHLIGTNALACEGSINLTQSAPDAESSYDITTTSTSDYVSVSLGSPVELSETAVSIYMMVLPGAQNSPLTISLKIDNTWKEMSKAQPKGGFVRGKKYVVALDTAPGWTEDVFTDPRDGNTYNYQTYGTQVWMTKNLAYMPSAAQGTSLEIPYYFVYGYDGTDVAAAKITTNYQTYGVLYNYAAALTACPDGWHLPSYDEWTQLHDHLGGASIAGGKMKETGTSHWTSPNEGATNESGFTALPGGQRYYLGGWQEIGARGLFWSSTTQGDEGGWVESIVNLSASAGLGTQYKYAGFSVRCLQD